MHAILITAYKNFDTLCELIESFDLQFEIYIHIDKKSKLTKEMFNKISSYPIVKLVSRKYTVNWGSRKNVSCSLMLAKEALENKKISYCHLISGEDFCVLKPDNFISRFENDKKDYLWFFELPYHKWKNGGLDRIEYYYYHEFIQARKYKGLIHIVPAIQRLVGHKRNISEDYLPLFGGMTWWSLSRETIGYVVDYTRNQPSFYNRLKYTFAAGEMYYQNVILKSKYREKVVKSDLRFIDWNNDQGNGPRYLDMSDFDKIKESGAVFARKYDPKISKKLKAALLDSQ